MDSTIGAHSNATFDECKAYARQLIEPDTARQMAVSLYSLGSFSPTFLQVASILGQAMAQVNGLDVPPDDAAKFIALGQAWIREAYAEAVAP